MKNIEAIIYDMDGVKYALNEHIYNEFYNASVKVTQKYFRDISDADALVLAQKSYAKYRSGFEFLITEHGLDADEIIYEFHENLNEDFVPVASDIYLQAMTDCPVPQAILTQGNLSWTNRLLTKHGSHKLIDPKNITTYEEYKPFTKANSFKPFDIAIEKLGINAEKILMIEDSQKNLNYAKKRGMQTLLVHAPLDVFQENYTDRIAPTPEIFLVAFNKAYPANVMALEFKL